MSCEHTNNIITLVRGNTVSIAIPLQQLLITQSGEVVEDYYPTQDDVIVVNLKDRKVYSYTPAVEGNVLNFALTPDMGCGTYGVEVLITKADNTRLRSYRLRQLAIVENNERAGLPDDTEFDINAVTLDAGCFIFAKGDKGDKGAAFEYDSIAEMDADTEDKKAGDIAVVPRL